MRYVYFIEETLMYGEHDRKQPRAIKIGSSCSVDGARQRLRTLQIGNPRELRLLGVALENESVVHRAFTKQRIRGEWFRRTSNILQAAQDLSMGTLSIDEIASQMGVRIEGRNPRLLP